MPTTVTISDVRKRSGIVERGLADQSSAFLVDEALNPVGGIKVYGAAIATRFEEMHIACHVSADPCIQAEALPEDSEATAELVAQFGYLVVKGDSPLGSDYPHMAPLLLLLKSNKEAERSWREGLEQRARFIFEQLPL